MFISAYLHSIASDIAQPHIFNKQKFKSFFFISLHKIYVLSETHVIYILFKFIIDNELLNFKVRGYFMKHPDVYISRILYIL